MKALVQFEIKNTYGLDKQQLKEKIVEHMVNVMDGWTKGQNTLTIEFIYTYEDIDKHTGLSIN